MKMTGIKMPSTRGLAKVKKFSDGGGLREGRARFSDDIRARATRAVEEAGLSDAEAARMLDREPKMPEAKAMPVRMPRSIKPTALAEPEVEEDEKPTPKLKANADLKKVPPVPKSTAEGNPNKLFYGKKAGGMVKKYASGGAVKASSASKRADGCAQRGKTKGRMI